MTNPFAPAVPAVPTAPAPAPAPAPQQGNPFAGGPPTLAQPAPVAPAWLAQPAAPVPGPMAAAAPPPVLDPAALQGVEEAPADGAQGARFVHMYGRLLLIFPERLDRRPRNQKFITPEQRAAGDMTQDQITATIVVLDSGPGQMQPITFGGDPYAMPPGSKPDTESAPLPYIRPSLYITQSKIITQLRDAVPAPGGTPGMRLGRPFKAGPEQNAPWFLQQATQQEIELASSYLQLVGNGTYPHPLAR